MLKEGDPPLSAEDAKGDLKATRKCYIYGRCPVGEESGSLLDDLPEDQRRELEKEKREFLKRTQSDWDRMRRKCAAGGKCPPGLTPQQSKKFKDFDKFDKAIHRCAAGFGCPDGITKDQAESLIGAEHERWKEDKKKKSGREPKKKHGAVPDNDPGKNTREEAEEGPSDDKKDDKKTTLKKPRDKKDVPDLSLPPENIKDVSKSRKPPENEADAPEIEDLERENWEKKRKEESAPLDARNPYLALAASVIAATPRQTTPDFFSDSELLLSRLPRLTGDGDIELPGFEDEAPDASEAEQDPDIERRGVPRSMSGETLVSEGYPFRAPKAFDLSRSNSDSDRYGTVHTSSRVWGKVWQEIMPGILINAEIQGKQTKAERPGSEEIGSRATADISAAAFIPIDDGGPEINAEFYISAKLPDTGFTVSFAPYTEDSVSNLFLTPQIKTVVGSNINVLGLGVLQPLATISGMSQALVGGARPQPVIFSFPKTKRGEPRGILVLVEGTGKPEVINKVDTHLGNDLVTRITEETNQRAYVAIRFNLAYQPD
ncbi:MAG: hypothetical protein ABJJ37_11840 [Roseibium sp.]